MQPINNYANIDGTRYDNRDNTHPIRYRSELAELRPHDEMQRIEPATVPGTYRITTAAHGYLVVPLTHTWNREARYLCAYGYQGRLATYLEEDCEAPAFIRRVSELEAKHHEHAHRVPVTA